MARSFMTQHYYGTFNWRQIWIFFRFEIKYVNRHGVFDTYVYVRRTLEVIERQREKQLLRSQRKQFKRAVYMSCFLMRFHITMLFYTFWKIKGQMSVVNEVWTPNALSKGNSMQKTHAETRRGNSSSYLKIKVFSFWVFFCYVLYFDQR